MEFKLKNFLSIMILLLFINCSSNENTRSFSFIYEVDIEPTSNKKLELWLPYPQSNEVQSITNILVDSGELKYDIKEEIVHGNKYIYIYKGDGLKEKSTVKLSFDVVRKEHKNVQYHNVNPENYLSSYSTVPTGSIFNAIIKNNELTKDDVKKTYEYVLNGMHYGKPKSKENKYYKDPWLTEEGKYGIRNVDRDMVVAMYERAKKENGNFTFGNGNSLYACNIGVGNCTDYHSYFMSLGRTMEIPVRFHMGFPIPDKPEGSVGGYHCWADYYVENEGWYPVDISEADKDKERSEYYFGTVCRDRVEMMVGRDFKLEGYDQGLVNLFIYPLMEVDDKIVKNFSKSFKYKNL